jgi:DNA-binding CsgD family transcriptional regulator
MHLGKPGPQTSAQNTPLPDILPMIAQGLSSLTPTEQALCEYLAEGVQNKEIAVRLKMTYPGVKNLIALLCGKLAIPNGRVGLGVYLVTGYIKDIDVHRFKAIIINSMRRMSPEQLDETCLEIERGESHLEMLREKLRQQVEEHGSTPPRAEKSKRLSGYHYQLTVSTSTTTVVNDADVLNIATVCEPEIFNQLFRAETRYRLINGASMLLSRTLPAGAPANLRALFSKAVTIKETGPRLRIEEIKVHDQEAEAAVQ